MKLRLLALAAVIGLAVAAPSLATAATGNQVKTVLVKKPKAVKHKVVKHKIIRHKKVRMVAKLNCAKPEIVKGVKQCPPNKDATPK